MNAVERRDSKITPLTKEQKANFHHVIFEQESNSPKDHVLALAGVKALQTALPNLPIAIDVEETSDGHTVTVRTGTENKWEQRTEGALLLGAIVATQKKIEDGFGEGQVPPLQAYLEQAEDAARQLVSELVTNEELFEDFRKYYGGLRWGTDKERFTHQLFRHGTDFDPDFVRENFTGFDFTHVVYGVDAEISYRDRRDWGKMTLDEVLKDYPDLDYRRLEDEDFRASEEGQKLEKAYTDHMGYVLGQRQHSLDWRVSKSGVRRLIPRIPLTRFPIIEALVTDEVALHGPRMKYHMGPSEVSELVLGSDSKFAHEALVVAINTRVPQERRHVFDGPNEFNYKHRQVQDVLVEYNSAFDDDEKRPQLAEDILAIFDEFTKGQEIVGSVLSEYEIAKQEGRGQYAGSDIHALRDIIEVMLDTMLRSPDSLMVARAEELINQYIPLKSLEKPGLTDELSLDRYQLIVLLISSVDRVHPNSDSTVFERLATRLFQLPEIGAKFREFAEKKIEINKLYDTDEIRRARSEMRWVSLNDDEKGKKARRDLDKATELADKKAQELRDERNDFLLQYIEDLATPERSSSEEAKRLFATLVKSVRFDQTKDWWPKDTPKVYGRLVKLAKRQDLPSQFKADILWNIAERFKYVDDHMKKTLMPILMDFYEVALGPVDDMVFPTEETERLISATRHFVGDHAHALFKNAKPEELQTLARYFNYVKGYVQRIATGAFITSGNTVDEKDPETWQKEMLESLRSTVYDLQRIAEFYQEYLHIEDVRSKPHVYYPWMLQELVPFMQKMHWEVSPGNKPFREVQELFNVLEDFVNNRLVQQESYPESFDCIKEGQLDSLLLEGYNRMIVPHDIKYNGTVWREGLTFMHVAVAYMPRPLLDRIRAKHAGTDFADYLDREWNRWNKDEAKTQLELE